MKFRDVLVIKKPSSIHAHFRGVCILSSRPAIHKLLRGGLRRPRKAAAWLALDSGLANVLLEEVQALKTGSFGTLALLEDITPSRLALASRYFRTVFQPGLKWLPPEQVIRILHAHEPRDRLVAGLIDEVAGNLLVYRGDLQPVVVPCKSFLPRAGVEPDFNDFEVIDGGNAVRFGAYEASADAVLYENDPDYRRRQRRQRRAEDRTFGASLRRLRLQRELRQSDFEPEVSARTIARIENNQVAKPHGRTLLHIAGCLGVQAEEMDTY